MIKGGKFSNPNGIQVDFDLNPFSYYRQGHIESL
jgi:hypothetical protein